MACGDEGAASAGGLPASWEVLYDRFDVAAPHVTLLISLVVSVTASEVSGPSRAGTLAIAALATLWVTALHTTASPTRRQHPRHALVYVIGLLGWAWLLMLRDPAFFIFAITGFLHAAPLRPKPLVFVGTGATSLLILWITWGGFPRPTLQESVGFLAVFVIQTALIGLGLVSGDKLVEVSEGRRRTVQRLEATLAENEGLHAQLVAQAREAGVTDERQRMAREIHDTLAQNLTGVITQLEAAQQSRRDTEALDRHLRHAAELAREGLAEARRSVAALTPGALEHGRLHDALAELAQGWSERTGISAEVTTTGAGDALPVDAEVALLRVAQESLANVAKHASATRVGVTLSSLGSSVSLDVRDDGRGFDPATVGEEGGFGLTSMRQRIEDLDGTLTVETEPGAGTAVSVTVPVRSTQEATRVRT